MTRRLRALNKGRLAVWWATHRRDAKNAMLLTTLVGLILLAGHFDHQDQLAMERAAREQVEQQLADITGRFGPPLPPTVFVLEARTPQELQERLAGIAGDLDAWRYRNRNREQK